MYRDVPNTGLGHPLEGSRLKGAGTRAGTTRSGAANVLSSQDTSTA